MTDNPIPAGYVSAESKLDGIQIFQPEIREEKKKKSSTSPAPNAEQIPPTALKTEAWFALTADTMRNPKQKSSAKAQKSSSLKLRLLNGWHRVGARSARRLAANHAAPMYPFHSIR